MNSVELVKKLCKERKIPISKLERDLGYSNGYIGQLRKGVFPTDRLVQIANYLSVPVGYLLQTEAECEYSSGNGLYPPEFFWDKINSDRARFLHCYIWGNPDCIEELENIWHISIEHPELASDETFKRFVEDNVRLLGFDPEEGEWEIRPMESKNNTPPKAKTKNVPPISVEAMKLAQDYDNQMDTRGRETVRGVADMEVARYKALLQEQQEHPEVAEEMPTSEKEDGQSRKEILFKIYQQLMPGQKEQILDLMQGMTEQQKQ